MVFGRKWSFDFSIKNSPSKRAKPSIMSYIFRVLFFMIFLFFSLASNAQTENKIDSLKIALTETNNDSLQYTILTSIINLYQTLDVEKAFPFAEEAVSLAKKMKDSGKIGRSYLYLGRTFANYNQPDSAQTYFEKALTIFENSGDKSGIAGAYNKLVFIELVYNSNFAKAAELSFKELAIHEELGNSNGIIDVYTDLAFNYQGQKKHAESNKWAEKALKLAKEKNRTISIIESLKVIAYNYSTENVTPEKAIPICKDIIKLSKELDDFYEEAIGYLYLGNAYKLSERYEEALDNYRISLEMSQKVNMSRLSYQCSYSIGHVKLFQNKYSEAIEHMERAFSKTEISNIETNNTIEYYHELSRAYEGIGNHKKSLELFKKFQALQDSSLNEKNIEIINELSTKYETEKKEQEIAFLTTKEKGKSTQLNYSLGLGALLLLLLGLLFNRFREKQKNNLLLEEKNGKIELLLKEIHHRVKNNLQTISSLLFLQSAHIKDADVKEAVAAGQHRVESMALIHQKLYQRDNLAGIEMKDYLTNLGNSLIDTFVDNPDRISLDVDMEEHELDVDTAVPLGLIANELITNSIKYAFPENREGMITLKIAKNTDEKLELLIADDGIGEGNTETGTAFGSQLIHLLTKQLNGTLEQGTDNGYWTKIVL